MNAEYTPSQDIPGYAKLISLAKSFEFDYCAYGIQSHFSLNRPATALVSNYPQDWQSVYASRSYIEVDPVVGLAQQRSTPFPWSADSGEFWEEAQAHDIRHGWSVPIREKNGTVALLSFARAGNRIDEAELQAKEAQMFFAAHMVHQRLGASLMPVPQPVDTVKLTSREKEILKWAADGKTANDISRILSLSERTVNFHICNAGVKLGASNRTQLVVKALMLGLLF